MWGWQPSRSRLRRNDDANSDPEGVYYIKVKKINLPTPARMSQGPRPPHFTLATPSEHPSEIELEEKVKKIGWIKPFYRSLIKPPSSETFREVFYI